MHKLLEIYKNLRTIKINLKKSIDKGYTQRTLENKLETIQNYKLHYSTHLATLKQDLEILQLTEQFYILLKEATDLLHCFKQKIRPTMTPTATPFNIETVLKIVPTFDGKYKEVDSFLKIIELIHDTYTPEDKVKLIDLIINVKLDSNVRTTLVSANSITTLEQLKTALKNSYKPTLTTSQIYTKLSTLTQRNNSVTQFKDKLISLVAELNNLQITELGNNEDQKEIITKINENHALNVFKNGLNDKRRDTVFAAQPKTLTEATCLALEIEKSKINNNQLLSYRSSNYKNSSNSRNFNNNRQNNYRDRDALNFKYTRGKN